VGGIEEIFQQRQHEEQTMVFKDVQGSCHNKFADAGTPRLRAILR
jgi:hypothetical protein